MIDAALIGSPSRHGVSAAFLACLLALYSGCGDGGSARKAIRGTVSIDGVTDGSGGISFRPLGQGPMASVRIHSGSYEFNQSNGPAPGKYSVTVSIEKGQATVPAGKGNREGGTYATDMITSTQEVEITAAGDEEFNINWKSNG